MAKLSRVEKINKEFTQEEFLRSTYIDLAVSTTTPTDILKSEFGTVKEKELEYILVQADVSINYSCTIGYDRKETYYQGDTKKTRTVTDWKPFHGSASSEEVVLVENSLEAGVYRATRARITLQTSEDSSFEVLNTDAVTVSQDAIQLGKTSCVDACFNGVKLPGDRQKDKDYSGTATIKGLEAIVLPAYDVAYKYEGKSYDVKGFACGKASRLVDAPNISEDVDKESENKTKGFKQGAIIALIVGVILNVMLGMDGVLAAIGGWCWLAYLAAIGLFIAYFVIRKKTQDGIIAIRQEEKKSALIELLAKKGYAPLTEEELALFKTKK